MTDGYKLFISLIDMTCVMTDYWSQAVTKFISGTDVRISELRQKILNFIFQLKNG